MAAMRNVLAVGAILAIATAAAFGIQRLNQDQAYRSLLDTGEAALRAGQTYAAIEAFSGALALRPSSMVAFYRRGEAYSAQGQDDRAVLDLQQARRLAPDAVEPLEALGRLYARRGDAAEAATWFQQAADRLKDADPSLLYALALARYRSGNPAGARDPLQRAIARNDAMPEAYYLLGVVYRDTQQADDAATALERAVRLAPSMLAAREELADLYRERGRAADEIAQLSALASLDTRVDRQIALAMADLRLGRYPDALEALSLPDRTSPIDARVALAAGRVLLARAERTGDRASVAQALAMLTRAIGRDSRSSAALALMGRAVYLSGDSARAETMLREAAAMTPASPDAFRYLADAAERQSHPGAARDALLALDALEGSTAGSDVRTERERRIGALALAAGDARTGNEYLTLAIKSGQTDAATLGLLARARWETGDRAGAREALGQALALNQRDSELRRLSRVMNPPADRADRAAARPPG